MATPMFVDVRAEVQQEVTAARRSARETFADILDWLEQTNDERRLWDVERGLATRLWELGRLLVVLWLVGKRPGLAPRTARGPDGRIYRWHGFRKTAVKTMFGAASVARGFYVIGRGKRGETFVPFDREVGIPPARFSLASIGFSTFLAAKMPFAEVGETLQRFWGWAPATKSVHKMVDQVAPLARPFLEAEPAPGDDGEILVIQADGKGAPMITETEMSRRRRSHRKRPRDQAGPKWRRRQHRAQPRKRRKKGDKSKNAKIATVGVIYSLRRTPDGLIEGPIHKRVYATFRNAEALFIWLRGEAQKRGYGRKGTRTLFLADGDKKLWALQQRYFEKAETCIDWCHVVETIWKIGATLHAEGSDELAAWVAAQTAELRAGNIARILRRLRQLQRTLPGSGPGTKGRRLRMAKGIKYLHNNRMRMPYARLRRQGLPIGTGAVEGAVRQLVGLRLDGPGMRWTPARAEHILHLRCIVLNGLWDRFMEHVVEQAHTVGLREDRTSELGSTHNAKRKAAA